MPEKPQVIVIGAGIGGLTAAALLLKAGYPTTVLEAQVYPGGCAGTFFHQRYRFDAGATLAGGFAPGGPHFRLAEILELDWPVQPVDPAWVVHLPKKRVIQWSDRRRWQEERQAAFGNLESFWQRQEWLAGISWQVSSLRFPWPPVSPEDWFTLARAFDVQTLLAAPYALRKVADLLPRRAPADFRLFLDAQLLIAAQTTAQYTNALYGSAALDLPRRGVNQVQGGIGSLAKTLASWIAQHGGQVHYRQPVDQIILKNGRASAVLTQKGKEFRGDLFLANLTPWALTRLLGDQAPESLCRETHRRQPTWGAFTMYLGLHADRLPASIPDHHQVIIDPTQPLGEGNSVFISLSDPADPDRAPRGMRAATLSTHTAVQPWWDLHQRNREAYSRRKENYGERLLRAAEQAIPGIRSAIQLCLSGTPVTFEFFTRRPLGMVGGFPQTSLFTARGPRTGISNLWLVGDSIFPGQSTAGVTLGALRVAADVLARTAKN